MNVLELIKEAAKRLNIMIPKDLPKPQDEDTNAMDYDANFLLSALNSTVKQMMVLNLFNQNIVQAQEVYNPTSAIRIQADPVTYPDIWLNLTPKYADFEELIGDGFTFFCNGKKVLYRQLTDQDYLRLAKVVVPDFDNPPKFPDENQELKNYMKDMPSEDRTKIPYADNLESGFYIYETLPNTRILYFCNNILTAEDISAVPFTIMFMYRSKYGVISNGASLRSENITASDQTLIIPDELAIIGMVLKYKAAYGLDYTLELGEQKAILTALKANQENIQITHLDKKNYYTKRN
jgi:hypothetical protein